MSDELNTLRNDCLGMTQKELMQLLAVSTDEARAQIVRDELQLRQDVWGKQDRQ